MTSNDIGVSLEVAASRTALQNYDILWRIFGAGYRPRYLDNEPQGVLEYEFRDGLVEELRKHAVDLGRWARVSRTFSDPALRHLWVALFGLTPLLYLLAPGPISKHGEDDVLSEVSLQSERCIIMPHLTSTAVR